MQPQTRSKDTSMNNPHGDSTFGTQVLSILLGTTVLLLFMVAATYVVTLDRPPSAFQAHMPLLILVGGAAGWIGGCILWHARIRNSGG